MHRILIAVALIASAAVVGAHETVPSQWCADGQPMTIGSFRFGAELVAAVRENPPSCQGTCGEPDDDYRKVTGFTQQLCRGEEDLRSGSIASGDVGDIVAIVQGPPAFVAANHHDAYLMAHGVWGICVLCAPTASLPPQPRRVPSR
ncbi:MAG TPA: hypothetical protein VLF18_16885 [Tahibacter sp.]|uniref:hypothetical protein n=1 Tax=Tahibacter sp. TaxID=2056211 RepID=UPI002C4E6500|nr:hypothetical protein [Tahibacter sp.]HSX61868.1 hypothetical protein [Tahibacter sp.]